ncbi:DNA glycosylase AlkZ-like family protein [Actinoplanes sp. NPDC051343]|uniref:DNA glycosylase AlkZ-like family protein n=1 Tax=Actinoplanes sp. NPDC051343 TaxID=3363906 RepID=UPI00378B207F
MHELSLAEARRIALNAQLLSLPRPSGVVEVVHDLTLLQYDQTAAVAPSADLVLWSRLGSGYEPATLQSLLGSRDLIELNGMIRPAADLPLYQADMAVWPAGGPAWRASQAAWVEKNDACRRDILARLSAEGPLSSRDIPDACAVPWESSGWNNDRNVVRLLDFMVARGEVAVSGRRGPDRLFDLASRVYPALPPVPSDLARRQRDERRLSSLGIARSKGQDTQSEPGGVGEAGEPAVISGVRGKWRVDPQLLDMPFHPRVALLSPLDRTIFDRKRMTDLFEFDYQLEMYKPAAKRRWGYWALPILVGDRLLGKVDAAADRKADVLRVAAIHQDETLPLDEVIAEIHDLADWLEMDLVLPR